MGARWLVVAMAVGGCVPVPADPNVSRDAGNNPGGDRLLDVDPVTGRVATTDAAPIQYSVDFATRNPRMPESVFLDGINRIAGASCPYEGGVGIGVYPALNASSPDQGGTEGTGSLTVEWAGPVIARIAVAWSTDYTCGAAQTAHGTSTFTLFPNGRIVRHDVARPSTTTLTAGSDCGCSSDSAFYFTSFWTFAGGSTAVGPDGQPFTDGASDRACAVYSNHTIGVAWPALSTRVIIDRAVTPFVFDWINDDPTLAPVERAATSAIILSKQTSAASCGAVLADLDDFRITSGGAQVETDESGIYQDPARHTARFAISTPKQLPRGFAISLDVGANPLIERSPPQSGAWYATQPDGARTVVWFRDGLAVDETISIEPR